MIEPISFGNEELDFLVTEDGDSHAAAMFWNQFQRADTLGSLIQPDADEAKVAASALPTPEDDLLHGQILERARQVVRMANVLSRKYAVVTANPPYMSAKSMDSGLTEFAKAQFKDSKSDLFAMFIQRCVDLTVPRGATAMITMQSWMFLTSHEALRQKIIRTSPPATMVHLGERAFDSIGGGVVSTTAFVLEHSRNTNSESQFIRVVAGQNESAKEADLLKAIRDPDCEWRFTSSAEDFDKLPGSPIAYWLSDALRAVFSGGIPVSKFADPRQGLATADNSQFLRRWWEVSFAKISFTSDSRELAKGTGARWFPYNKGGEYRKWWGNQEYVVNWADDGRAVRAFGTENGGRQRSAIRSPHTYFQPSVSWSDVTAEAPAFRVYPPGFIHDVKGMSVFGPEDRRQTLVSLLNSSTSTALLAALSPTLNTQIGQVSLIPVEQYQVPTSVVNKAVATSKDDWDDFENSWNFESPSWLRASFGTGSLQKSCAAWSEMQAEVAREQQARETENNRIVTVAYGLQGEVPIDVSMSRISLTRNVQFRYGLGKTSSEYERLERADFADELVSYAIGCMFGRYSLDEKGLILGDEGAGIENYLSKVSSHKFMPYADNVIPFVDDGWFEDDIVERFRQFLRTAFGAEHFEENLRFVEESLGVKAIRDYFIAKSNPSGRSIARSKFYDDHVQRYKKRPIYWMFSSPRGSFNALIYLHRYTPATVSTVLNEYLREYRAKLEVALQGAEEVAAGGASAKGQQEADRLRAVLAELRKYERDVLYPLDIQSIEIDLDDGVKANYPKFAPALRPIKGLAAAE